jgi:hypothetical protein
MILQKLGEKRASQEEVTVNGLIQRYGRPVKDTVLATFLERDVRTIRKHARSLGGREVIPGVFFFSLEKLDEVLLGLNEVPTAAQHANFTAPEPGKVKTDRIISGIAPPVIRHSKGKGGNGKLYEDKHGLWKGTDNNKPLTKPKKVEEPMFFEGNVGKCPQKIG